MSSSAHTDLRSRIEAGDLHFLDGLVLLGTIASQRWFGGKSRDVLDARVLDAVVAPGGPPILAFAIVEVRYGLQSHDLYHLPLGFRPTDDGWNESVIAETEGWTVYDAIADPALIREAVSLMRSGTTLALRRLADHVLGRPRPRRPDRRARLDQADGRRPVEQLGRSSTSRSRSSCTAASSPA